MDPAHVPVRATRAVRTAPHYLPVNRTAASIGLTAADVGPGYRSTLIGARTVTLTQAELLRLPQHAVELPIACVEGWSVAARWTGVRLADLARLAGMPALAGAQVDSIQQVGAFKSAVLSAGQVADPQSLLAVTVNGHVLPAGSRLPGPDDHPERARRA